MCPFGFGGGDAGESLLLKADLTLFLILEAEELSRSTTIKNREEEGNRAQSVLIQSPRAEMPPATVAVPS